MSIDSVLTSIKADKNAIDNEKTIFTQLLGSKQLNYAEKLPECEDLKKALANPSQNNANVKTAIIALADAIAIQEFYEKPSIPGKDTDKSIDLLKEMNDVYEQIAFSRITSSNVTGFLQKIQSYKEMVTGTSSLIQNYYHQIEQDFASDSPIKTNLTKKLMAATDAFNTQFNQLEACLKNIQTPATPVTATPTAVSTTTVQPAPLTANAPCIIKHADNSCYVATFLQFALQDKDFQTRVMKTTLAPENQLHKLQTQLTAIFDKMKTGNAAISSQEITQLQAELKKQNLIKTEVGQQDDAAALYLAVLAKFPQTNIKITETTEWPDQDIRGKDTTSFHIDQTTRSKNPDFFDGIIPAEGQPNMQETVKSFFSSTEKDFQVIKNPQNQENLDPTKTFFAKRTVTRKLSQLPPQVSIQTDFVMPSTIEDSIKINKPNTQSQEVSYTLNRIICGGGLDGGHYWSFVKKDDGSWFRCDDIFGIKKVNFTEVQNEAKVSGRLFTYDQVTA